jgi:hypothetical protein
LGEDGLSDANRAFNSQVMKGHAGASILQERKPCGRPDEN